MTNFRFTLIPTLITIPSLILLVILGTWQVQRLQWKNQVIADITKQIAQPIIDLPADANTVMSQYQKVRVTGELLYDKEIFLFTGLKEFKGKVGYDVLTPMKRADGSVVLIDRGWIPAEDKISTTRKATEVRGPVNVEGVIMRGEKPATFTPANDPEKNVWFWIDIQSISKYIGSDLPDYYIMQAANADKTIIPIGRTVEAANIRNDHLQYAITWYSAAISLLVIYFLYHRKPRKEEEKT